MINVKELGFLFGYLEKSAAIKWLPKKLPKGLPLRQKPPVRLSEKPTIRMPAKTQIIPPVTHSGEPKISKPVASEASVPVTSAAPVVPNANIDAANALGQAVGASPDAILPWNERLHQSTGIAPKTWSRGAGVGLGLLAGKLVNDAVSSERELEFRRDMAMMNPFMYGQSVGQPGTLG